MLPVQSTCPTSCFAGGSAVEAVKYFVPTRTQPKHQPLFFFVYQSEQSPKLKVGTSDSRTVYLLYTNIKKKKKTTTKVFFGEKVKQYS